LGGLFGREDVRNKIVLRTPGGRRWRFAGAERGSRGSQIHLKRRGDWVRATEHASCDPFYFLKRRHGLAEIVERGAVAPGERLRINPTHPECGLDIPEDASRHGHHPAEQFLSFFEAP
jgi:hypothetical protein